MNVIYKTAVVTSLLTLTGCSLFEPMLRDKATEDGLSFGASATELIRDLEARSSTRPKYRSSSAQFAPAEVDEDEPLDLTANSTPDAGLDVVTAQVLTSECHMRLGQCKTTVKVNGTPLSVIVETGNQNGYWYQTIRNDKTRTPFKSYQVISYSVYSVDGSGALIDMNSTSYITGTPVKGTVRRVE